MKKVEIQGIRETEKQGLSKSGNFNRADTHAKWGKPEQRMEPDNINVISKTR